MPRRTCHGASHVLQLNLPIFPQNGPEEEAARRTSSRNRKRRENDAGPRVEQDLEELSVTERDVEGL